MSRSEPKTEHNKSDEISWQASEYIHHDKSPTWYASFLILSIIVLLGVYLILQDLLSMAVIGLMLVAVAVFANRKPRNLNYTLSDQGIAIGDQKYTFASFLSFSLVQEGDNESLQLTPSQKFMPPITIYFNHDDRSNIIDLLGSKLPYKEQSLDSIDKLAKYFRF